MWLIGARSTRASQTTRQRPHVTYYGALMVTYTDRAWWTVEDAAPFQSTIVSACPRRSARQLYPQPRRQPGSESPPGPGTWPIPPQTRTRSYHLTDDAYQYELDLGPMVPIRRYRNGDPRRVGDYEVALSIYRTWRNAPQKP